MLLLNQLIFLFCIQIANIGPIGYSLLRAFLPRPPPPHIIILIVLVLGCGASLGLALSWSVTSEVIKNVHHIFHHLSPRFKNFGSSRNSLNPTLRPNLRPNSDDSLCHVIDSCEILARLKELGPMKIKPTLVGFSEE